MHAAGNAIMCEKCGFAAAYTRTGKIVGCGGESSRNCPARIDEWYDGIRSCVAAEVKRPGFALSEPVRVMTENEKATDTDMQPRARCRWTAKNSYSARRKTTN